MPAPFADAYAEALASAPTDVVILNTLEFRHPAFTTPLRVVADYRDLRATLESVAPVDASTEVAFVAYAFSIVPPTLDTVGKGQIKIAIDNVARDIGAALEAASASADQIELTWRAFLSSDLSQPQNNPTTWYLSQVTATQDTVTATASLPRFEARRHPSENYTDEEFPGLIQ